MRPLSVLIWPIQIDRQDRSSWKGLSKFTDTDEEYSPHLTADILILMSEGYEGISN